MTWNIGNYNNDRYRSKMMQNYCDKEREKALEYDRLEDEDYKHYMFKLTKFHSMLLLLTSQQTNDELLCK